ncbi:MAG: HD domain-containing protein [Bacteriovoracaceae bacterium]|nr:HD domain-containing protein [Bacteriovoracaceae bacterium]
MTTDTNKDNFSQVPLSKISPNENLPSDIYIKIADKYIKFKPSGEPLTAEKYNLFLARNVGFLFVEKSSLPSFIEWTQKNRNREVQTLVDRVGEEHRELAEASQEMEESVVEIFTQKELTVEHIKQLESDTTSFIEKTKKYKTSQEVLANLTKFNLCVAGHSVNVGNLSVFLAMALGQGHQYVLENLYLGALFHDYARAKIDPEILKNTDSSDYKNAMNIHPTEAVNIMKQAKKMPEPVYMIVGQHEEHHNGEGYPNKLKGDAIYSLTRILSFCNIFENLVSENKQKLPNEEPPIAAYIETLKTMKRYKGTRINPDICEKSITVFCKALGISHKDI